MIFPSHVCQTYIIWNVVKITFVYKKNKIKKYTNKLQNYLVMYVHNLSSLGLDLKIKNNNSKSFKSFQTQTFEG